MSIQPLSSTSTPAYTPQAAPRPATDASAKPEAPSSATGLPAAQGTGTVVQPNNGEHNDKQSLQEATHRANQAIAGLGSDLKFTVDDETGMNVVKFIDVKTQEVIRQIPAQEMLVIAKRLDELQGLLIKERA